MPCSEDTVTMTKQEFDLHMKKNRQIGRLQEIFDQKKTLEKAESYSTSSRMRFIKQELEKGWRIYQQSLKDIEKSKHKPT